MKTQGCEAFEDKLESAAVDFWDLFLAGSVRNDMFYIEKVRAQSVGPEIVVFACAATRLRSS